MASALLTPERQRQRPMKTRPPFPLVPLVLAVAWTCSATGATPAEDPDTKAARIEAQMTDAERMSLLVGIMPIAFPGSKVVIPAGVPAVAGYVPGVPRLGVPAQLATDAGMGVANPGRPDDVATAMPAALAVAASFDPELAARAAATVAREARAKGFNILLAGGVNLARDPRNGRNFEYQGEDPLLAGTMVGHAILGAQAQGVVSTIKHFAVNAQETLRMHANAQLPDAAMRESDLLAFELGIEIGQPQSVMCAYNLVNGAKACGSDYLLNAVLKRDWGYKGWVMSDWGAVTSASFLMAGLDQQEGSQLDEQVWFGAPLERSIASGQADKARVSDAVRRILRGLFAVGITEAYTPTPIDYAADAGVALDAARAGIVLLKNDGALPIAASAKRILVVGGNADFGVLSGGGSSQVMPSNGKTHAVEAAGEGFQSLFTRQHYLPGAPLAALRKALPDAKVTFDNGYSPDTAAAYAAQADLVVVFATKWDGEAHDSGSLELPQGQDTLIARLAAANRNVVVVLETGNPVTMPWLANVRGVVQAWFPGQQGGQAIADVLTGQVNPSGRLPLTFPAALAQTPRGAIPGIGLPSRTPVDVPYPEGADVGYKWFARTGQAPLFAFGHGLSYTRFTHGQPWARAGQDVVLGVTVANAGARAGADVPQAYLVARNGRKLQRLVGFQKVALQPGEKKSIALHVDPRLLADFGEGAWKVPAGVYTFAFGTSAQALETPFDVTVAAQTIKP
jgi:beta-glucosidase